MKAQIWYKPGDGSKPYQTGIYEVWITGLPDIQSKSGYHLVLTENDPPKPSIQAESVKLPTFPNTLQGIHNFPTMKGIAQLGKAASQLPALGYVASSVYPNLLTRLVSLAQAYDMLRQELLKIPEDTLHLADEAAASQK